VCFVFVSICEDRIIHGRAGNVVEDTMEDALDWASCSFKSFLKKIKNLILFICIYV